MSAPAPPAVETQSEQSTALALQSNNRMGSVLACVSVWGFFPQVLCVQAGTCVFGVLACQTNHFAAGGSNSFTVK